MNKVHQAILYSTVAVICGVFLDGVCFAGEGKDFEFWSTAKGSFDINRNWKFNFEEEFRLKDDAGELYYHHTDLGFIYRGFRENMDLGFNYRQAYEKNSSGKWNEEHRPHLNVTLKGKLLGLDVSDRSRLEFRDKKSKEDVWRYRNKFTVKLPFELTRLKLKPYIADEIFYTLDDDNIDKNRFYAGFSVGLSKDIKGEVFYLLQTRRSSEQWDDAHVLGVALKLRF